MRAALAGGLLWLAGCAASLPVLKNEQLLSTPLARFAIHYDEPDSEDVERLQTAIRMALPRLKIWGEFRQTVHFYVLRDHEQLERASGRFGYDWLRAWARNAEVLIQAPHSWGSLPPLQSEVNELVLHELCHCLVYQQSSEPEDWQKKKAPLWFREGIAAWTAGQAHRWPTLDELSRFYAAHPDQDPLLAADQLYREQSNFVYAAAYYAFAFLVNRYGEESVRKLLHQMRDGATFIEAFAAAFGLLVERFLHDFERFVRSRGFEGDRRRPGGYRSAFFVAQVGLSRIGGRSLPSIAR